MQHIPLKKSLASLLGALLSLYCLPANALDVTAAVGFTGESTWTLRLAAQSDFKRSWWVTDTGQLSGYWDGAYTYWQGDKTVDNHSLSLSPVFRYEFNARAVKPYVEAGIGLAAFSKTRLAKQKLSTALQFEDRIGMGLRFAQQEVGVRVIHYSNAGIKRPNDGVENYTVHYRMYF